MDLLSNPWWKWAFKCSLRPQTVASGASPSLRTLLILTGIAYPQICYFCQCQYEITKRILLEQQSYLYR